MTNIELRFFESAIHFFTRKKKIDWEQRKYEISKEILPEMVKHYFEYRSSSQMDVGKRAVEDAISIADTMIEQLKLKAK